jgi:hypothetical protein
VLEARDRSRFKDESASNVSVSNEIGFENLESDVFFVFRRPGFVYCPHATLSENCTDTVAIVEECAEPGVRFGPSVVVYESSAVIGTSRCRR